jgi:hypothetical protein
MPARHGIAAAAIVTRILPCGLLLRRQIAVRIAEAIARAQIPAMAAWRRMGRDTVLHGLRLDRCIQDRCNSGSGRHAQLNGQGCGGNAGDHGPSPIKPEAAGVSTTRLPVARSRSTGCVAFRQIFQTPPEYPVNAFQASEVKSLQRPPRDRRCSANRCSAPPR